MKKNKVPKFSEPPRAIIITFSTQFFYELGFENYDEEYGKPCKKNFILYGYKLFLRQMHAMQQDPESYWCQTLANPPAEYTENLQYCYISILKKIRFKASILSFERGTKDKPIIKKKFSDGKTISSKGWILLNNFVKTREFPKNGFQGFRYVIPGSEIDKL